MKYFSSLLLLPALLLIGCGEGAPKDLKDIEYEDVKELIEEIDEGAPRVRGSCNMIAEKSHCMDYIGSFWTDQQIQLQCTGAGTYSKNTCPYSELGGCKTTGGTMTEAIIWSYGHGGSPIATEDLPYVSGACNTNPMGEWVLSD